MLTYTFENKGELPIYEYLYQKISSDIREGVIKPNEKLPSKRSFAKHLGISTITVENAYSQLLAEGFITAKERKGYYACQLPNTNADTSNNVSNALRFNTANSDFFLKSSNAEFDQLEMDYLVEPLSRPKQDNASIKHINLINGMATDIFPFNAWAKSLRDALSKEPEKTLVAESTIQGTMRLRTVLCDFLKNHRGMNVEPEQIVIGAGSQYLYSLIAQFIGSNRKIALEDPGYDTLYKVYESHGHKPISVTLDNYGMDINALIESDASVAHIIPSHQFPTGMITTISRRYDLLSWASQDKTRIIIEDDYDCEFRLAGKPIPPLCNLDTQGQVIYTNTFTKSLGPAFRIAYMVLPKRLIRPYLENLGFYTCPVSATDQLALAHFIESGNYERHINRAKNIYRGLRNSLINALSNSDLKDSLIFKSEDAGLHFVLGVKNKNYSTKELIDRAEKHGVLIRSLLDPIFLKGEWSIASPSISWFLINYGGLSEEQTLEVSKRLEQAWN